MPPNDVTISTAFDNCSGVLIIDNLQVSDACSDNVKVTARVYQKQKIPVLDDLGGETGTFSEELNLVYTGAIGDEVSGLTQGFTYVVKYDIADICGNAAMPVSYQVTVEDTTPPIAVCRNDVKVVLNTNERGRLRVDDVDGGSRDNCTLFSVWIRRALANELLRDTYLELIYGLSFDQLQLSDRTETDGQIVETWVRRSNPIEKIFRKIDDQWYTAWAADQWFLCDDLGERVQIELLAVDESGLVNVCNTDVTVEKQQVPYCEAPADVNLMCLAIPNGFDPDNDDQLAVIFGNATALDDCDATATQINKIVNWNCSSGTIERVFQAENEQGQVSENTCKQIIHVSPAHNYEIIFPQDVEVDCGVQEARTIQITEIACDMLSVNTVDRIVAGTGDACYGIERTFKVINWCEWDGESDPVVVDRNPDCDEKNGEEDVYVLVRIGGITYIDRDNNENGAPSDNQCGNGLQRHLDNSERNPDIKSTGYWKYTQVIQVFDRSAPIISFDDDVLFCSSGADCSADVFMPLSIIESCAEGDIQIQAALLPDPNLGWPVEIDLQEASNAALVGYQLLGSYPSYIINGRFPIGDHRLIFEASDGCLHTALDTIAFSVVDCKGPVPDCSNGLVVDLMAVEGNIDVDGDGDGDTGALEISASDFSISGLNDCSDPITLSINRLGETPDRSQTSLLLTCEDLDTVFVEIYAWDSANNPMAVQLDGSLGGSNHERCLTYIVVNDDLFELCEITPEVSGRVATRDGKPVEYVDVSLAGQINSTRVTARDGTYAFENLPVGGDYTLFSSRNDDHRNGINTFDLLMLNKHLLRTRQLENPYQIIAADVNQSNTVSTLDLIHMRRLLLTIYTTFPASESWRFIPASYAFPDPNKPFTEGFPEVLSYNDVQASITNADFVGFKMGDLNGSAQSHSGPASPRSLSGIFTLQAPEQKLESGQKYRVPITANNLANIQGYQFTLDFETSALQLEDIEYGLASEESFGLHYVDEGVITTSWIRNFVGSSHIRDFKDPLFTLVFHSHAKGQLSDHLHITSRYTEAEAYNEANETLDVDLEFRDQQGLLSAVGQGVELYQNVPNPWNYTTQISFYLPEAGEVTLSFRDLQGRSLKRLQGIFAKGTHQLSIRRAELPASGVLYYTLETEKGVATRRMVLVE